MRDPILFNLLAIYPPGGVSADDILGAVDEEIDRLVGATSRTPSWTESAPRSIAAYLRKVDSLVARALTLRA